MALLAFGAELSRANIHDGQKLSRSFQGPDTETQDLLSPDHPALQTRGRSIQKCQFGYRKVRYRGIAKNGALVFSLWALANLYLARRTLASA